ncbi:hypothetical protein CYY_001431 [Polysphondylium violaceum]|uniref:Translation initiation factor 3 N-terminal domain-containing protein n=1 Tax=Polysphondylium violaceum TaxID=133409 RepID=A0A8J4Q1Y8_9MYCE|nr:hypothetical protein CYY_001431 [Polysphondylium violaceum]
MFKLLSLSRGCKPLLVLNNSHSGLFQLQSSILTTANRFYSKKTSNRDTSAGTDTKRRIPGKNKYDIVEGWDDPINEILDQNFHISQKEPPKSKRMVNNQKKKRVSAFEVFLEEKDKSSPKRVGISQHEKEVEEQDDSIIDENTPQGKLKKMMRDKVAAASKGKSFEPMVPESYYERDLLEEFDEDDYYDNEIGNDMDDDELHQDFMRKTELMEERDIIARLSKERQRDDVRASNQVEYITNQIFSTPTNLPELHSRLSDIDEYKGESTAFNDDALDLDEIRIIDQKGKQMGIYDGKTAFKIAKENNIDLILNVPKNQNAMVIGRLQSLEDYCEIQELKIQRELDVPEMKVAKLKKYILSSNIGQHDKIVKFNAIKKALDTFHPVEVIITFKTEDFDLSEGEKMLEECKGYVRHVGRSKSSETSSRMLSCLFNPLTVQEKEAYEKKMEADRQRELKKQEKLAKKEQLMATVQLEAFEHLDGEEFIENDKKSKKNKTKI